MRRAIFLATLVFMSSQANAICEPERRAIDDRYRECKEQFREASEVNQCIREQVRPAEERYKQCIRNYNEKQGAR